MVNGIDGLGRTRAPVSGDGKASGAMRKGPAANAAANSEKVSYSDTLAQLKRFSAELAQETPVDRSRVDALREAISNGEYVVDSRKVAEQFMRLEKELGTV